MILNRDETIVFHHGGREWIVEAVRRNRAITVRIVGTNPERRDIYAQRAARRWFIENQGLFDLEGLS
jgi:hypothetical protein